MQNPFEDILKLWQVDSNSESYKSMVDNFSKFQTEVLKLYGANQSSSDSINHLLNDIFSTIVKLSNRVSELETRLERIENQSVKK